MIQQRSEGMEGDINLSANIPLYKPKNNNAIADDVTTKSNTTKLHRSASNSAVIKGSRGYRRDYSQ